MFNEHAKLLSGPMHGIATYELSLNVNAMSFATDNFSHIEGSLINDEREYNFGLREWDKRSQTQYSYQ